ncbi:ankyrin repeat domain-containing protein [Rhodococcus triatomae]
MRAAALAAALIGTALVVTGCGSGIPAGTNPPQAEPVSDVGATATAESSPVVSAEVAEASLFEAAAADDAEGVREALAQGASIDARGEEGRTPLVAATKANAVAAAIALIDAGADVNAKDDMHDSAFLYAGAEGLNEILARTLAHGADVLSTNRFGGTALIPASEHGYGETVRMLVAAGVPVNHVNDPGWTALLEAVVYGDGSPRYVDVVTQLLDAGADPSIRDADGLTALDHANRLGQWKVTALLPARR